MLALSLTPKANADIDVSSSTAVVQLELYGKVGNNRGIAVYSVIDPITGEYVINGKPNGSTPNWYNYGSSMGWVDGDPSGSVTYVNPQTVYLTYDPQSSTGMQISWRNQNGTNPGVPVYGRKELGSDVLAGDIGHLSSTYFNEGGVQWMQYALIDFDYGVFTPWRDADIVANAGTGGWTATFSINRTWENYMGLVVRFGDQPIPAPTPEPATLLMFGIAVSGAALARVVRRKRK